MISIPLDSISEMLVLSELLSSPRRGINSTLVLSMSTVYISLVSVCMLVIPSTVNPDMRGIPTAV